MIKSRKKPFRSGFVGIVGRTNVGKSTLLNTLVKSKVAITSHRPQTTRHRIRCVLTRVNAQIVFIDTPGFHKPRDLLGERLNKAVTMTIEEVDVVLFMIDAGDDIGAGDRYMAVRLSETKTPVVVAMNKIDRITNRRTQEQKQTAEKLGDFKSVVPISARSGENVDLLVDELVSLLEEGPQYYPSGVLTDEPENVIIAEFIREKILDLTREEVPHSVAVVIDEVERRGERDLVDVSATIYVEKDSQKGILIGKQGGLLKQIAIGARKDIEALLGSQINLKVWVKVEKDWRRRESAMNKLEI